MPGDGKVGHAMRFSGRLLRASQKFGLPLEALLSEPVYGIPASAETMASGHKPSARQLAVGFPVIIIYLNLPAAFDVQTEQV